MNKKVLMGLLVSFIACEAMASSIFTPFSPLVDRRKLTAEMQDSPMTQLMKQRKAKDRLSP